MDKINDTMTNTEAIIQLQNISSKLIDEVVALKEQVKQLQDLQR